MFHGFVDFENTDSKANATTLGNAEACFGACKKPRAPRRDAMKGLRVVMR